MPFDALGRTRATMMLATSIHNALFLRFFFFFARRRRKILEGKKVLGFFRKKEFQYFFFLAHYLSRNAFGESE